MRSKVSKYPAVSSHKKAWDWTANEIRVMQVVLAQFRYMLKSEDLRLNELSGIEYMVTYCRVMNDTIGTYMNHMVENFEECHELFQSFKARRLYMESRARLNKYHYHQECSRVPNKPSVKACKP